MKILVFSTKNKTEIENLLKMKNHQVDFLEDLSEIWKIVKKDKYHVIILEDPLDERILSVTADIKHIDPRAEIIFMGQRENSDLALNAIRRGAAAYIGLPDFRDRLPDLIDKIEHQVRTKAETGELEKQLYSNYVFMGIVGHCPKMLEIFSFMKRIAPYKVTVLISGESGTGKEIIASAIHNLSPWAKSPFMGVNCSALTETLLESELFGHEKGSFTGANSLKKGIFETASEGTVFLDEIGDLSLKGQADLLRVLQNREYKRVGNAAIFTTNCRVIAATNKNLDDMVGKGKFREDLYYRLNMFEIKMPPLRERKDEIKFLCAHFIDKFNRLHGKKIKGISRPAKSCLFAYNWPGNVRELENVMERAIVSTTEDFIREDDLPLRLREDTEINHEEIAPLHEFEKKYVERVLSFTKGNRTECAKLLAISRRALGRKIEKLKIGKDKN